MEVDDVIAELYRLKEEIFSGKARNFAMGRHRSRISGRGYRVKKISRWKKGEPFHSIDWKTTLKTWPREIYKIETAETKEVPIFFIIDTSPSMMVRYKDEDSKLVLALRTMATLGFTTVYFNEPVGVASFGLAADFLLVPRHGKRRILNAVEILMDGANNFYKSLQDSGQFSASSGGSDINKCLSEVLSRIRRQSVVAVISDFTDILYERAELDEDVLSGLVARHKRNVVFIILDDANELSWTGGIGTIMTGNIETGRLKEIKSGHAALIRAEYAQKQATFQKYLENQGIDSLVLSSNNWFDALADFAASRHSDFH